MNFTRRLKRTAYRFSIAVYSSYAIPALSKFRLLIITEDTSGDIFAAGASRLRIHHRRIRAGPTLLIGSTAGVRQVKLIGSSLGSLLSGCDTTSMCFA